MNEPNVLPARKLEARVEQCFLGDGQSFVTRPVSLLPLGFDGIALDRHRGVTRPADARVPWYPRGAPIHNERHVSAISVDDLEAIRAGLEVPALEPFWLGANLLVAGVPRFSFLPRGTRLHFPSGAALAVADQNAPCRGPGRVILANYPDRAGIDLEFPKVAKRRRGLVLWVERPGEIRTGDTISVRLPEQWLYDAS